MASKKCSDRMSKEFFGKGKLQVEHLMMGPEGEVVSDISFYGGSDKSGGGVVNGRGFSDRGMSSTSSGGGKQLAPTKALTYWDLKDILRAEAKGVKGLWSGSSQDRESPRESQRVKWVAGEGKDRQEPNYDTYEGQSQKGGIIILVTGSRGYTNKDKISEVLQREVRNALLKNQKIKYIEHGGADGADKLVEEVAKSLGIPTRIYKVNWRPGGSYDPSAGMKRNSQMLWDAKSDKDAIEIRGLSFFAGEITSGTANMTKKMMLAGIEGNITGLPNIGGEDEYLNWVNSWAGDVKPEYLKNQTYWLAPNPDVPKPEFKPYDDKGEE